MYTVLSILFIVLVYRTVSEGPSTGVAPPLARLTPSQGG
jgi:hypothetical protein